MDINLIERTICPICRNKLQWNIKSICKDRIIEGYAECVKCKEIYPIQDEIVVFLPTKFQNTKIWERSERVAVQKNGMKNDGINENIQKPSELLDMIHIRNMQGNVRNEDLYCYYMDMIGMPETLNKLLFLAQRCADEISDIDYVLDFASGKCLLANVLRKTINCHVIVSDINPIIVKQAKQEFERQGIRTNLSFMVFDIKRSPFSNKSIQTITTLLGLQNIIPCYGVMKEIDRIADVFFNISVFLKDKVITNIEVLKKFHMMDVWIKDKIEATTEQLGWNNEEIYTVTDLAKGVSREEIETRFAVMKFPVEDELVEYNLTKHLITVKK